MGRSQERFGGFKVNDPKNDKEKSTDAECVGVKGFSVVS